MNMILWIIKINILVNYFNNNNNYELRQNWPAEITC